MDEDMRGSIEFLGEGLVSGGKIMIVRVSISEGENGDGREV